MKVEILKVLQSEGYDIGATGLKGTTPMILAVKQNNLTVLRYLIHECPNDVNAEGRKGNCALHYACSDENFEAAKLLCTEGNADVNIQSNDGWTPVMWAAYTKNVDLLIFLLKYHPDSVNLQLRNAFGDTALAIAMHRNLDKNVEALKQHSAGCNTNQI